MSKSFKVLFAILTLSTMTCAAQYINPFNPGSLDQDPTEQEDDGKTEDNNLKNS